MTSVTPPSIAVSPRLRSRPLTAICVLATVLATALATIVSAPAASASPASQAAASQAGAPLATAPLPAATSACRPYPDVTAGNPHCANIAWLSGQGITKPVGGKYLPRNTVNRGSMAAFLFRLVNPGASQPACKARPFRDVPVGSTFCGYISWAKANGIAYGYGDGTYRPATNVTRGAMAAYLYRIANPGRAAKKCTTKPFADVSTADTFCAVITWMAGNGITYGVGDGTRYGTTQSVTRQSMASFLRRIFTTPGVLQQAAPAQWEPTGIKQTFSGVTFLRAKNWRGTANPGVGYTMLSPRDSHGYQCAIYVLAPIKAAGSESGRIQQSLDVVRTMLPGETLTNQDGQPTPLTDAFRGATGRGWDYVGLTMHLDSDGDAYSIVSILARFGSRAVPLVVIEEDSPYGNDTACVGYDGDVGPEVARVFFSLSMGTDKPNDALATKVLGNWWSSSSSVGNSYTFGRNGRYIHASAYGGTTETSPGSWQDVYASWSGTGGWAATGDQLAFFPTNRDAYRAYARVLDVRINGTWTTTLCMINSLEGKPYSYCTHRAT